MLQGCFSLKITRANYTGYFKHYMVLLVIVLFQLGRRINNKVRTKVEVKHFQDTK